MNQFQRGEILEDLLEGERPNLYSVMQRSCSLSNLVKNSLSSHLDPKTVCVLALFTINELQCMGC